MRSTEANPQQNILPKGTSLEQVVDAIELAGYPLQGIVARKLMPFVSIVEEWGYVDSETQEHRSLDLFGFKSHNESGSSGRQCLTALLVECKKSRAPFVFFKRAAGPPLRSFPLLAGVRNEIVEIRDKGRKEKIITKVDQVLCLYRENFIAEGPPICASFSRGEVEGSKMRLSGEQAYKGIVLPLVKATRHAEALYSSANAPSPITLIFPFAVLDAPMVLVESPESAREPVLCPWVRIVRHESNKRREDAGWYRWDTLDVVHVGYLDNYLSTKLIPFLQLYAQRVEAMSSIFKHGGVVPDLKSWSWSDITPA